MASTQELNPSNGPQGEKQDHPSHLSPSELGTKEYWESFYETSLSHLSSSKNRNGPRRSENDEDEDKDSDADSDDGDQDSDPGTSWFTEHNAPEKVLQFMTSEKFPFAPENQDEQKQQQRATILDLGTGNGSMLALLRDKGGFKGRMVGVDYSGKSVELARRLWPHDDDDDNDGIRFEEWDILTVEKGDFEDGGRNMPDWFPRGPRGGEGEGGFDIVLDKGTFDAVSLSDEVAPVAEECEDGKEEDGRKGSKVIQRRVCERYPGIARRLVKKGGFLIVTSCNWTEEELVRWFTAQEKDGGRLVVWDRVEYPRFKFGGQEGQGVYTVCFKRRDSSFT